MHEDHDGTQWSRNNIHAWSQRHLSHIARTRSPHDRSVEIELSVIQFSLQSRDQGVLATDLGFISEARLFQCCLRLGQGLFCRIDIARRDVEGGLGDHLLLEQLRLPVVIFLGERELNFDLLDHRGGLVIGGLELLDGLLSFRKLRRFLIYYVLVGPRIDFKKYIALLQRSVNLDWNLDHPPFHVGHDRGGREVNADAGGEGIVVVHDQQNAGDQEDASQNGGRQSPLVDRDPEDLAHCHADPGVSQYHQEFHYRALRPGSNLPINSSAELSPRKPT